LGHNKIGDKGGKAIGKALEVSPAFVSSFSFSCAVISLLGNPYFCDFGAAGEQDAPNTQFEKQ
jgi:hypothetical protein